MRRHPFDLFEDLNSTLTIDTSKNTKSQESDPLSCPHVTLFVEGVPLSALMDTGSQVTCISESFYQYIKDIEPPMELPVVDVAVYTAIGKKPTPVKRQIRLDVMVRNQKINTVFLVIPQLTSNIILGNDWMINNGVIIDFSTQSISIRGIRVPSELVLYGKSVPERLDVQRDNEFTYIQILRSTAGRALSAELLGKFIKERINGQCSLNVSFRAEDTVPKIGEVSNGLGIDQIQTNANIQGNSIGDWRCQEPREVGLIEAPGSSRVYRDGEDDNFYEDVRILVASLENVSEEQKNIVEELVRKFKRLFSCKGEGAGDYVHEIRLKDTRAVVRRSYPVPFALREEVGREINDMLVNGIIERSTSQYCNPLRVVKKQDGRIRIYLDARFLNNIIESDNEAPPLISELLQKYHGTSFISTTDLAYGYWQIPLARKSRPYTAFLYGSQLYQFCRIPFGLKTAGSGFIRALSLALGNEFDTFLTCYIDDLLITSSTFEEHLKHLQLVFQKLQNANFTLRLDKSFLFRKEVNFLGFVLSTKGIRPEPDKLEVIRRFAEPKNLKQLQQIIGVCTYYRQFSVRKGKNPWVWTVEHSKAFENLKSGFANNITLCHVILDAPFKLQTDASDRGISGVLYQTDANDEHYIISLVSRCLNEAEKNYNTTEKELLAIVYAISKCRTYLVGRLFYVITDHEALTFLNTTPFQSARLIRWSIYLQGYTFEVRHCVGRENIVADFFSRNPDGKFEDEYGPSRLRIAVFESNRVMSEGGNDTRGNVIYKLLARYDDLPPDIKHQLSSIGEYQREDSKLAQIIAKIESGEVVARYQMHKDVLFRAADFRGTWQVAVPEGLAPRLIKFTHAKLAHPGYSKTLSYIKMHFSWDGMNAQVKKYVLGCDLCQRVKGLNYSMEGAFGMVPAGKPTELVTVDFYGPLPRSIGGVEYIFVMLDVASKYVKLYPLKRATTRTVLKKIIENYIPEMGKPSTILSDNGTQFTSPVWKDRLAREDIRVIFSSVRHPQSNPTERVMRELGRLFRTL